MGMIMQNKPSSNVGIGTWVKNIFFITNNVSPALIIILDFFIHQYLMNKICFWIVINLKTVSSSHQTSGGHPGTQGPGEGVHPVTLPSHPGPAPPTVCCHRWYARLGTAPVGPPHYTDEHDAPGFTDHCPFVYCGRGLKCLSPMCRQCFSCGDGGLVGPDGTLWLCTDPLSDLQTEPDARLRGPDLQVSFSFSILDFWLLLTINI